MEQKKTNTLAIVGFILTFIIPIVGFILCIIALVQIGKTGEKGKGLAIAGIVIDTIGVILIAALFTLFTTLLWPTTRDNITSSVYCTAAYDCEEQRNGKLKCYYCEDGEAPCTSPKTITCSKK